MRDDGYCYLRNGRPLAIAYRKEVDHNNSKKVIYLLGRTEPRS